MTTSTTTADDVVAAAVVAAVAFLAAMPRGALHEEWSPGDGDAPGRHRALGEHKVGQRRRQIATA